MEGRDTTDNDWQSRRWQGEGRVVRREEPARRPGGALPRPGPADGRLKGRRELDDVLALSAPSRAGAWGVASTTRAVAAATAGAAVAVVAAAATAAAGKRLAGGIAAAAAIVVSVSNVWERIRKLGKRCSRSRATLFQPIFL